jgi:hypothetical protein
MVSVSAEPSPSRNRIPRPTNTACFFPAGSKPARSPPHLSGQQKQQGQNGGRDHNDTERHAHQRVRIVEMRMRNV